MYIFKILKCPTSGLKLNGVRSGSNNLELNDDALITHANLPNLLLLLYEISPNYSLMLDVYPLSICSSLNEYIFFLNLIF